MKVKQSGALDVSITLYWNFILHIIDIKMTQKSKEIEKIILLSYIVLSVSFMYILGLPIHKSFSLSSFIVLIILANRLLGGRLHTC